MKLLLAGTRAALGPFALAALLVYQPACAKLRQYDLAPAPRWVRPLGAEPTGNRDKTTGDQAFLLVDRQIRVRNGWAEYQRFVVRVVNAAGTEDASQLSIDFDPKLDHLIVHAVQVRRGAQVIDELRQGRIEVLQRESNLEDGILDGSLTFHLLMSDVRVGDVIDESYTIEHHAPAWDNRFFERFTTRWDDPVARSRLRVLIPQGAPLFLGGSESTQPVRRRSGDWRILEWNWSSLPAVITDGDVPSWYEQHPSIQLSQFAAWGDLVKIALPLFSYDDRDPAIAALAANLESSATSPQARALAAVRFVQEKIRYTGLELGSGAYRPRPPGEVLRTRFGDCKDKALLTVALLRAMGIDAAPALASTRWMGHLHEHLPSPGDFDHAIVRMRLAGVTYWIDVTETAQGGVLRTLDQAHEGEALVIASGITSLETMPDEHPSRPLISGTAVFDLRSGPDAPGDFTISTVYRGSRADDMRRKLRRESPAQLGKGYLEYYRGRYPEIQAAGPPVIGDDPLANVLTVKESYRIAHPFQSLRAHERRFEFNAEVIDDFVQAPAQPVRTRPLALDYPLDVTEKLTVRLPSFFATRDEVVNIDDPVFRYESQVTHSGNDVTFQARYRTLADAVLPRQLDGFLDKLERIRGDSALWFTSSDATPDKRTAAAAHQAFLNAMTLVRDRRNESADAALKQLLASPGFDALTADQQHTALTVAGAIALQRGASSRALALLKRACGMQQAEARDWELRAYAAQGAGQSVEAGFALTTAGRRWPDAIRKVDFRIIGQVLHALPDAGTNRYDLLSALHEAKYTSASADVSAWWRDLALLQIEQGELEKARATAADITDPYALISVRADDRFASVRQHLPAIEADVEQQIRYRRQLIARDPAELGPVLQLSYLLLFSAHFHQALQLTDSAIATVNGPRGAKAYQDYGTMYVWILDTRARALACLGRWDEAVAQLLSASHLPEVRGDNVSQVINLAGLYNDLGRPDEARATLAALRQADMSPYGRMQAQLELLASADELGNRREVERQLAHLRAHREDSLRTYNQALVSANRLDAAARLLISRLQDPAQRTDALMEVQTYRTYPLPRRARKIQRRWRSVIQRRDVRAAIERVGSIGSYALIRASD
jgi:transglutaminase-like putative cysteine protease